MYIQQTIRETANCLFKNLENIFYRAAYTLISIILLAAIYSITFLSSLGIPQFAALKSQLASLASISTPVLILGLAVLVIILIAISLLTSIFFKRIEYLTSKGQRVLFSSAKFSELWAYTKSNFVQYFLLVLSFFILSIPLIAIFVAVLLLGGAASISSTQPMAVLSIVIGSAAVLVFALILGVITSTADTLFFMGNEQAGPVKLLKDAFALVKSNLKEYILLLLTLLAFAIIIIPLTVILAIIPCIGSMGNRAVELFVGFVASIFYFVFIAKLLQRKK